MKRLVFMDAAEIWMQKNNCLPKDYWKNINLIHGFSTNEYIQYVKSSLMETAPEHVDDFKKLVKESRVRKRESR